MSLKDIDRTYTNGEITVTWKPTLCTRTTICFSELPEVFDPEQHPWIIMHGADTDRIIAQVKKCPSGALSCHRNT